MIKKISPLAPENFPKLPSVKGVLIGTAKSGTKYKGRRDIFTAIFEKQLAKRQLGKRQLGNDSEEA